jgi:hypothetical protein
MLREITTTLDAIEIAQKRGITEEVNYESEDKGNKNL